MPRRKYSPWAGWPPRWMGGAGVPRRVPGTAASGPPCPDCGTPMVPVDVGHCTFCLRKAVGGAEIDGTMYLLCDVHLGELVEELQYGR